jgi:hypothetical protein
MTNEQRETDEQAELLVALYAEADRAYRSAREAVFDDLPAGGTVDFDRLTDRQQAILIDLREAEETLDTYRRRNAPDLQDSV